MIKRLIPFIALLCVIPAGVYSATPKLEKIQIAAVSSGFTVRLQLSRTVRYDVFSLSDPTRIVVNLYGAEHKIRRIPKWPRGLGLTHVRISQFEKCPVCIVRMVLQLEGPREQWTHRTSLKKKELLLTVTRQSSPQPPSESFAAVTLPATGDYHLGPGDLLDIQVFELPNVTFTMRVAPDGTISLVPLGRIKVEGKTPRELEDYLRRRLKESFIQDPHVSVNVREFQSQTYTVIGAVNKPGSFPLFGRRTVLAALADAGGLIEGAGSVAYLYRRAPDGGYRRKTIDLNALLNEGNLAEDIPLQAGDILSVPLQEIVVYVYGAVRNPGVVKGQHPFTVLRALAAAGGPAERAALGGVRIIHSDGKIVKVDIGDIVKGKKKDVVLKRGDVVYVPTSLF